MKPARGWDVVLVWLLHAYLFSVVFGLAADWVFM